MPNRDLHVSKFSGLKPVTVFEELALPDDSIRQLWLATPHRSRIYAAACTGRRGEVTHSATTVISIANTKAKVDSTW